MDTAIPVFVSIIFSISTSDSAFSVRHIADREAGTESIGIDVLEDGKWCTLQLGSREEAIAILKSAIIAIEGARVSTDEP